MRKIWSVVIVVAVLAVAALGTRRVIWLYKWFSAAADGTSDRRGSGFVAFRATVPAADFPAVEISQRGPGMRRRPPDTLKLPVPRTLDLTHVTAANFATALGDDPVRIFNYVRDEIAYESYTGCLRGPRGTLLAMAGNSVDRASLLASMLQHARQRVRFAHGTLAEPLARELVTSMWAERSPSAPAQAASQPSPAMKAAIETLVSSIKRDYTLVRDQLKKANVPIGQDSAPRFDSLLKETQDHYWVQWWKDDVWVDLDPSFSDSSPGGKYASAEHTFDTLPEALFHQVEIQIRLEEYTGSHVSSRVILSRRARAADLSAVDVVLSHQPENWQGPVASLQAAIASAIQDTGRIKPVLLIGEKDWAAGEAFYPKKPSSAGMGGVFNALAGIGTRHDVPIATAESVELKFIGPDGGEETVVRNVFDIVGDSVRAAGKNLPTDEVGRRTDIAVDVKHGVYCLFFTTGRVDADNIPDTVEPAPASQDQLAPNVVLALGRFNILFSMVSDGLVGRVGQSELHQTAVLFYQDSPRLSITELSGNANNRRFALDLRRDHARAVALGQSPNIVPPTRLLRGVTDGTLERVMVDYVRGQMAEKDTGARFSLSTSALFARAETEGVPTIMLPQESSRLEIGFPENTLARLRKEFSGGMVVVAPQRPIFTIRPCGKRGESPRAPARVAPLRTLG